MPIPNSFKARIAFLLKALLGAGLLAIVCRSVDFRQLADILRYARIEVLFLVWVTYILDRVVMALKWNLLLKDARIDISGWQAVRIYFTGNLLGTFTPGELGADAYRIFALSKLRKNATVVVTVVLERVIGLAALVVFVILLLPFSARVAGIYSGSLLRAMVYVLLTVGCFFLSLPMVSKFAYSLLDARSLGRFKTASKLKKLLDLKEIPGAIGKKTILLFSLLTIIEIVLLIYMNYLTCRSLRIDVSFIHLLLLLPGLYLILRLPVTIQGLGIQEGLWVFVMRQSGFSSADGIAVSVMLRLMQIVSVYVPASLMMMVGKGAVATPSEHADDKDR